jgi:Na+/melibiose symporter-like transporter
MVAYAMPAIQTSLVQGTVASVVPTLYATDFGLSLTLIGMGVFVSRVGDAFVDPTVGYLSDHTRSRLGRRKPWVIAGGLLTMVSAYCLLAPAAHPSFAYFLTCYVGLYLGWSVTEIPHAAWGFEITRDYQERSRLFAWRIFMLVAGQFGFLLVPLLPMFKTTAITPEVVRLVGYCMLAIVPITAAVAVIFAPAGIPAEKHGAYRLRELISMFRGNRPLVVFMAASVPYWFALGMFGALSFLYFRNYLGLGPQIIYLFMILHGATLLFMPTVPPLIKLLGKHRTWALGMAIGVAILPLILFVHPGPSAFVPLAALFIPIGLTNALSSAAPPAVYGDVVDFDTLKTGKKRAASYAALLTLVTKLSLAAGSASAFTLVGLFGYNPNGTNGPHALLGLKVGFVIAPAIIYAIAICFAWIFPIDRRRQALIKQRLETREARSESLRRPLGRPASVPERAIESQCPTR